MVKKKVKWYDNFWLILTITIILYFLPDPIPFIDEIIFTFLTVKAGMKEFKK